MKILSILLLLNSFNVHAFVPEVIPVFNGQYINNHSIDHSEYDSFCIADAIVVFNRTTGNPVRYFSFPDLFTVVYMWDDYIAGISKYGRVVVYNLKDGKTVFEHAIRKKLWNFINVRKLDQEIEIAFVTPSGGGNWSSIRIQESNNVLVLAESLYNALDPSSSEYKRLKASEENLIDQADIHSKVYSEKELLLGVADDYYAVKNGTLRKSTIIGNELRYAVDIKKEPDAGLIFDLVDHAYDILLIDKNEEYAAYWGLTENEWAGSFGSIYYIDNNKLIGSKGWYYHHTFDAYFFSQVFDKPIVLDSYILFSTYTGHDGNSYLVKRDINAPEETDFIMAGGVQTLNIDKQLIATSLNSFHHNIYSYADDSKQLLYEIHISDDRYGGSPILVNEQLLYLHSNTGVHVYSLKSGQHIGSLYIHNDGTFWGRTAAGYTYSNRNDNSWLYYKVGKTLFSVDLLADYFDDPNNYLQGYISADRLEDNEYINNFATVSSSFNFVYSDHDKDSERLTILHFNDGVFITKNDGDWAHVLTASGIQGWVLTKDIMQ